MEVYSQAMNKNIPVTIVLPEGYASSNKYSTIYTLHGWSGNNRNYPEKTGLGELADQYNVIYVSPDGNYDSWYVDSELKKTQNIIPLSQKNWWITWINTMLLTQIKHNARLRD